MDIGGGDLTGRVAIVTGASSGIGRATALALATRSVRVALAARNVAALQGVAAKIEGLEQEALVVPTDVTQRIQVQHLVEETLTRWNQVDIFVANAGQYVRRRVADLDLADVERSMAVNFYGALHGVLAVLPNMLKRQSGHIVLVTSIDGKKGMPRDAPYAAAKFALAGFGEVMRQELFGTGVHVTTVCPGRVDTPMIEALRVPWVSPKIAPEIVARAIVRGIRHRRAEIVVPSVYTPLLAMNVLLPRFVDWFVRVFHIEGWKVET